MRLASLLFLFLALSQLALAQNPIQGVVNVYTPVTAIACNKITVQSSAGFTPGQGIVIAQMKGATVDQTNTVTGGDITSYGDAGNYEIGWIQNVIGNDVYLLNPLLQSYDITQTVQLVRVPVYNDATVIGTVTAQPWNGTTGGIIAFICTGTLTMNADIDANGVGYNGGAVLAGGFGCNNLSYALPSFQAGYKGESIASVVAGIESGRGKWASGGGGGNPGNSGGGGGALAGVGGLGGLEYSGCGPTGVQGIGGQQLTFSSTKAFLGGGGGGGYGDNGQSVTPGTNGGGLVIIRANTIAGNNFTITANGVDQLIQANDESAGGGGSGGSIYLDITNYISPVNLIANGGKGGDTYNNIFTSDCHGPGGGGSGGYVAFSQGITPANVNVSYNGGLPGMVLHPTSSCFNTSFGATQGGNGTTIFNVTFPESTSALPTLDLGNDTTVCPDGSFTLQAPAGFDTYLWHDGSTNQSIAVTAPGLYSVFVTTPSGCSASDTVLINTPPLLSNDVISDTTICPEASVTFSAPAGLTYEWSDGSTAQSIVASDPGTYSVTITDATGCAKSDTADVTDFISPTVVLPADTFACAGGTVVIQAPSGFTSYSWSDGGATSSVSMTMPGTYVVTITDANGCTASDDIGFTNTPVSLPGLADKVYCPPAVATVIAPSGYASYDWSNGQIASTIEISQPGAYALTITDFNGCTASGSFNVVEFCEAGIFFPNAFSPNADGLNDVFRCICFHVVKYEMRVYDRWGRVLFTSNDPDIAWNGKYKNQDCEVGTYVYAVSYSVDDGSGERTGVASGNFTLMR